MPTSRMAEPMSRPGSHLHTGSPDVTWMVKDGGGFREPSLGMKFESTPMSGIALARIDT